MWLINVETFELEFFPSPPPRYAILSHTWGADEVIFEDMHNNVPQVREKLGWAKIQLTCEEARRDRCPYAWVDTCCINKASSAELSEAINSMFSWYRSAVCCYAYLSESQLTLSEYVEMSPREMKRHLAQCRWFTRGWTLQELIVPRNVVFFSRGWDRIGTKATLLDQLVDITGIDPEVLEHMHRMFRVPVARRMAWAARRQTTRVEDMAYCLLGIFNVNLPLLYGEGEKAFIRLQEEIAKQHRDLSLFAWRQRSDSQEYRGIFAQSPSEFAKCTGIVSRNNPFFSPMNFTVSERGMLFEMDSSSLHSDTTYVLFLNCLDDFKSPNLPAQRSWVGIYLQKFGDVYVRAVPEKLAPLTTYGMSAAAKSNSGKANETICVQKTLAHMHAEFIKIALAQKILLLYRAELTPILKKMNLELPSILMDPEVATTIRSVCDPDGIQISRYHDARQFDMTLGGDPVWWDSFVVSTIEGEEHSFALVCGLSTQPEAAHRRLAQPWFALFSNSTSTSRTGEMVELMLYQCRRTASPELQRQVSFIIFELYADQFGIIAQEELPTSVRFRDGIGASHEIRTETIEPTAEAFCVNIQYLRLT